MSDSIGSFKVGDRVMIGTNGGEYEDREATVMTLDHDHGWRLWVIVSHWDHVLNDPNGVSLYLSPDDLDHVIETHKIRLSELKRIVDSAWLGGDGVANLDTLINRGHLYVQHDDGLGSMAYREDLT
mgnify:CR=1 FL=1